MPGTAVISTPISGSHKSCADNGRTQKLISVRKVTITITLNLISQSQSLWGISVCAFKKYPAARGSRISVNTKAIRSQSIVLCSFWGSPYNINIKIYA